MVTSVRPDPTEDLHWGSWDKSIHEVFAENALRHPERPCVTETTPWRVFTYQHINEASNVLAHHLVKSGVQRNEVVMLYSHRGVDLVVAIMGVLKAGATFSVIDPLYPAARQIIYLDVARPRALVVLKKARETAGGFAPEVTSWISENLQLRTTVPDLVINDNGELSGGAIRGQDVLKHAQPLKSELTGVVVGPDSTPTLSFTSGSEGRPKGVQGRHFSLLHYFPWMAERFGLSEKDRFTMLSGIAHDPIQRDIFTPLFLGAQLYVPSPEDIQHELLAKWMEKYETTVTHLTPAMGQILVGGASNQFPALRNAFFVGDVLIKRDVRKLQDIAPNCTVINMFGTTETQRAVSYYAVRSHNEDLEHLASLPDVIPAGKGMKGVQLLVLDRETRNRQCDIGEAGEIYVRAAGLAEGYLALDEQTTEKFVMNPFVDNNKWADEDTRQCETNGAAPPWREFYKGPRDRLYKSGDLGHYTESGDVVCTGRVDNQVKIRGFRFELGDVDSNLSSNPLVRENVTLLRRDENEEAQLISFVVPDLQQWQKWLQERNLTVEDTADSSLSARMQQFQLLRQALRDYMKTKVPSYAVPSVIVPLDRIPLNPNGKPDRPVLFERLTELPRRPPTTATLTPTEKIVAEIWGSVLEGIPANTIDPEDSWLDLGGNSIKANSMIRLTRQEFKHVRLQDIYEYPTLKEFGRKLDSGVDGVNGMDGAIGDEQHSYASDAEELVAQLPEKFQKATSEPTTVLLTGATGFLGAFILSNLLARQHYKVIALVRGSPKKLRERIQLTCTAYGLWSASWESRLECVTGDLSEERLGLDAATWRRLSDEVDLIIHNGARVDWLLRYRDMRTSNVLSTLSAIQLAATGKGKRVTFISSTAVLDNKHYIEMSEASKGRGISEDDDLAGSRTGLSGGYGQSKWVSEYLMREAGRRGLEGAIIRPGYVLGSSKSGASITDDFLIRMLKGAVQLGSRPDLTNTVNMVPVDHVAQIVVSASLNPPYAAEGLGVAHVTPHPRLSWTAFLGCLEEYYDVKELPYHDWRQKLLDYVENGEKEEFAALPLLDLLTSDFPGSSRDRLLSDSNTLAVLAADEQAFATAIGTEPINPEVVATASHPPPTAPPPTPAKTIAAVTPDLVSLYISYLVQLGFMPQPTMSGQLPKVEIGDDQWKALESLTGRGRVLKAQ